MFAGPSFGHPRFAFSWIMRILAVTSSVQPTHISHSRFIIWLGRVRRRFREHYPSLIVHDGFQVPDTLRGFHIVVSSAVSVGLFLVRANGLETNNLHECTAKDNAKQVKRRAGSTRLTISVGFRGAYCTIIECVCIYCFKIPDNGSRAFITCFSPETPDVHLTYRHR